MERKDIVLKRAVSEEMYRDGARLFREYTDDLHIDLSFQQFEEELNSLPRQYGAPSGALLLAYDGKEAVGCVAIRALEGEVAELKRMFVRPEYRGQQIGRLLLEGILLAAKDLGYRKVRLDSLLSLERALSLYRSYGFEEIAPYRFNPFEEAVYMEKVLA